MTHWTVVSHPGPVESGILQELAPAIERRRCFGAGVQLRVLEGGSGGAPPVVLLHGRGHAATTWWPMLPSLARRRRVVAFDLPGFGHSASRPWRGGSPRDALQFFVEPIAATLLAEGLSNAVVVGHSLGGLIALSMALDARLPLAGLVLIDAMGLAPDVRTSARLYYGAGPERLARLRAPIRAAAFALGGERPSRAEGLRRELLTVRGGRPDAGPAFAALCPPRGEPFHLRDRLGEVRVPTLLLWGDCDEAFPLAVAAAAVSLIPGAELKVLAAGHSPHVERPEEVERAIEGFLAHLAR